MPERSEHRLQTYRCPTCESPSPNMHPAIQCGGEVEPCVDPFHDADDRQGEWISRYIAEKRARAST